ncbi:MAG: Dabb family protein [Actinomycetota bacterium]|nr:Dabb family protein [Actinomycetota bacterium]
MIRHVVLLTLRSDAPGEAAENIVRALRALPEQIPSIREYQAGVDLGVNPGNATVAATSVFDDRAGYLEYRDHPAHRAVIKEYIDPYREGRAAIQFEI